MDANYFKSWKFAFVVASAVTILGTGYRVVNRHWSTHSANATFERYLPDGHPSFELRQHNVALGMPPSSLYFTLDEMVHLFEAGDGTLDWEPGNGRSVLLKATLPVPLEQQSVEVGFQLIVADPPQLPASTTFPSGAVIVTAMSLNDELADPEDMQAYLLTVQQEIDTAKGQHHFNP